MARVLVVEDVDYITGHLVDILTAAGYEVDTAINGVEGLEAYAAARPDAVLLDLGMPILDGWKTLPRMLALDPDARIIIHSGFINATDHTRLMALGAVGTLVKKLEREPLLAALAAAQESPARSAG